MCVSYMVKTHKAQPRLLASIFTLLELLVSFFLAFDLRGSKKAQHTDTEMSEYITVWPQVMAQVNRQMLR